MWKALKSIFAAEGRVALQDPQRWVVLDVESTGLDARTERLVSIAAVAVHVHEQPDGPPDLQIHLDDSFEVVIQHDEPLRFSIDPPSERVKSNVLVHGIGLGAQAAGVPAPQALQAFAAYAAGAPLLGYHVWFDQTLIERSFDAHGLSRPQTVWLDLEDVARGSHNEVRRMALDGWLDRYGIECTVRHDAAADTLASAELLVRLWHRLARMRATRGGCWQTLQRVAGDARFLAQP